MSFVTVSQGINLEIFIVRTNNSYDINYSMSCIFNCNEHFNCETLSLPLPFCLSLSFFFGELKTPAVYPSEKLDESQTRRFAVEQKSQK